MKPSRRQLARCLAHASASALLAVALFAGLHRASLVQQYNQMLDDSSLTSAHEQSGSLSPFYNDQAASSEQAADRDVVRILGEGLARLRFARMLDGQQAGAQDDAGLGQEVAELLQSENKQQEAEQAGGSLSSSVANMLLNVAQAAAQANEERAEQAEGQQQAAGPAMASRGSILELDTSAQQAQQPSKADLKSGPSQWYNPKETIPVLKISSMATPSKYKKVYFRSEKKLVDGAFHSPAGEQEAERTKSALAKPFNSAVQRRSSRGSSAAAPPSVLQDGVIDFLKKFRDVYVQTRPAGSSSSGANLASSVVSAAASSPFASILAPSSGSRPNLMGALSTASQMVNGAAMLSQAASGSAGGPSASPSAGSSSSSGAAAGAATAAGAASAASPSKSPLTAQSYVSFWSKTFPTWVRKMLKQMRRRSLHNSSKRQQHQHAAHQHHSAGIGQKIASGAVSGVVGEQQSSSSSSS